MGGESVMNLVRGSPPFEFFYSRFHSRFAPGFTPDSRSNLIALVALVQGELLIISM